MSHGKHNLEPLQIKLPEKLISVATPAELNKYSPENRRSRRKQKSPFSLPTVKRRPPARMMHSIVKCRFMQEILSSALPRWETFFLRVFSAGDDDCGDSQHQSLEKQFFYHHRQQRRSSVGRRWRRRPATGRPSEKPRQLTRNARVRFKFLVVQLKPCRLTERHIDAGDVICAEPCRSSPGT